MTRAAHPLRTDLSLRAGGLLSLVIAAVAIHTLARLHPPTGALAALLATIGFLCASGGTMLVVVGRHVHDRVRVSARWRRRAVGGAIGRDRAHPRRDLSTRAHDVLMLPHCSIMTTRERSA